MDETVFDRAVCFAVKAHEGQKRKDGAPYILHLLEDAAIVGTITNDLEVLAAAALHDTVEDTGTTPEQIKENFGDRVYELVMHETENKRHELPPAETWRIRKEESLEMLAKTDDRAVKIMWLGDKLSNIRGFFRMYQKEGYDCFKRCNNHDPRDHCEYYGRILELLRELEEYPAYKEYELIYRSLFSQYLNENEG